MTGPYRRHGDPATEQVPAVERPTGVRPVIHRPRPRGRSPPMSASVNPTADTTTEAPRRRTGLAGAQRLGRSLMLPIAALPAAGLLLRLGQPDLLGRFSALEDVAAVIAGAGNAIFSNLPLIFAVGIAIGWAKKADGSTALAAVVGYVVLQGVFEAMSPIVLGAAAEGETQELINYSVLGGVVTGLIAAVLWQRFYRIKLPT